MLGRVSLSVCHHEQFGTLLQPKVPARIIEVDRFTVTVPYRATIRTVPEEEHISDMAAGEADQARASEISIHCKPIRTIGGNG